MILLVALLAVPGALQFGCEDGRTARVEVDKALSRQVPAAAAASRSKAPLHDLAVISLDFDPPLRLLQIDRSTSDVALLAAVDNKGESAEKQVVVIATLRSQEENEVLTQRRAVVEHLSAGQATIVRFDGFARIPRRSGYVLTVSVEAVAGEVDIANNTKTVPLQLVLAN
jgi:hypothetical protein